MSISTIATIGILLGLCIGFAIGLRNYIDVNKRLRKDCDYYGSTYLRKQGATSLWGGSKGGMINYDLRSFDGGKNWYAVSNTPDDGVIILGKADDVYPGLLKQQEGLSALFDYVKTNGPLTLTNQTQINMLKNAGFEVKQK